LSYGAGAAQELVSVDASGLVQANKRLLVGLDGYAFQRGVGDRGGGASSDSVANCCAGASLSSVLERRQP
jgi:hypothetical protein